MAKINVKVDNLEEVKLEKNVQSKSKKEKETKNKKQNAKGNKKTTKKLAKKAGFFAQVKKELRPVTWPTKKNMFKYSLATIFIVVLLALFFVGLSALFDLLYGLVQGWIG